MLEELFNSSVAEELTFISTLWVILSSIGLGLLISIVYMWSHKKEGYSGGFTATLIMLPAIIAVIILLIGNNVARAFSLAGAFSLIRYRSAPGDPKDIAYVFFTLGVGLACGLGYIAYAALFAVIMLAVMAVLSVTKFGEKKSRKMKLKITLPENMDYKDTFNKVFSEYLTDYNFLKIKTLSYGSMYEVCYSVNMKDGNTTKEFIDKLRAMNGNLNISLSFGMEEPA
jgi:hypothetical protein